METKRFIGRAVRRFFIPVALCLALLPGFKPAQAAGGARNDSAVSGSFSSHLPVIVIENGGSTSSTKAVSVYSGSPAGNSLGDVPRKSPGASFDMRIAEEPGQTGPGKKSYTLSLASADAVSLAGLPEGTAWRLQGSARDKGMLRNGIAYMLARTLFPDTTPEIRFCEVLFKNGETYSYEGIYILAQRSEQKMLNGTVLEYSPGSDKRRTGGNESFIGLSLQDRGFSSAHSRPDESAQGLRMETAVDKLENALHSLQPDAFLSYAKALDQRSAVDLYLLNALLLNDKAGPVPFYISGENDGRLRFSPVWRFDEAFDNTASRRSALGFEEKAPVVIPPSILARKVPVWRQLENGGDITNLRLYPVYSAMGATTFCGSTGSF